MSNLIFVRKPVEKHILCYNIMDILYYSNYCKHCQKILQTLVKGNMKDKINFICIDKRTVDPKTGQIYVLLETGSKVILPPNIHSVPSLLLINKQYKVIMGDEIIQYFHPQFTSYNATPEELSAKGMGGRREMYNYVSASDDINLIPTPPDTYRPDKLSNSVTIDTLQQQRMDEVSSIASKQSFI